MTILIMVLFGKTMSK